MSFRRYSNAYSYFTSYMQWYGQVTSLVRSFERFLNWVRVESQRVLSDHTVPSIYFWVKQDETVFFFNLRLTAIGAEAGNFWSANDILPEFTQIFPKTVYTTNILPTNSP